MKCLPGIKNDYFEYNQLYSTFGKNTIEPRINNLQPSFVEIGHCPKFCVNGNRIQL